MKKNLRKKPEMAAADDPTLERYLTVRESAKHARVSEAKIRLDLTKGLIPRFKYGSRTLIRLRDLERLIKQA